MDAGRHDIVMKPDIRKQLAREPYPEKIRKVGQLLRLVKTFPRRIPRPVSPGSADK